MAYRILKVLDLQGFWGSRFDLLRFGSIELWIFRVWGLLGFRFAGSGIWLVIK